MFSSRPLDLEGVGISDESHEITNEKNGVDPLSGGGVTWDEPTIAEHDKERGTRMKINEPNTPYNADRGAFSSDDENSSMDVDTSPRGSQKLSPRFAMPPSPKRPSLGSDDDTHSGSTEEHEAGQRKIRSSAEPIASGLDTDALQRKVEQVKDEREQEDAKVIHAAGESDDEEFMTPGDRAKKAAFAEKRKEHYNEFKRMKELLSGQGDEESDSSSSEE